MEKETRAIPPGTAHAEAPTGENHGLFGLPDTPTAAIAVVGVPVDATASYGRGTADGPAAILEASGQLDLYEANAALPDRPYESGIRLHGWARAERGGPTDGFNSDFQQLAADNRAIRQVVDRYRETGWQDNNAVSSIDEFGARVDAYVQTSCAVAAERASVIGLIGGDHSVAFSNIQNTLAKHPEAGILHIDAHADLRPTYEGLKYSHASIMHRVLDETDLRSLVCVGLRDLAESEHSRLVDDTRITAFLAVEMAEAQFHGECFAQQCHRIMDTLPREVYVSFDIDGLDFPWCPHTGTPVPGGLRYQEATYLLSAIAATGRRLVGFDLVETAAQRLDAIVGARILYRLCAVAAAGLQA